MIKIIFSSVSVSLFYLAELVFFSLRYLTLHVRCISLDMSTDEGPISDGIIRTPLAAFD